MSAEIQALKEKLVLACQILANEGQGDFIWGHVTVRSPERPDHIFMKPHMLGLSDVQAEDVITVDIDGNKVEGKGRRHTEVFIHTEIMRARPDVQCVVHTHPPHCIVFGALGKKMQPIGHYGSLFCEALPEVWGRAVAEDLGDKHVLLLRNHGIVATGPYIEEAVMRALFLDIACKMQITAESAGGAKLLSPEKDWRRKQGSLIKRDHMEAAFAHLVRKLHNK
jgi:ribulose-5-phosphate 4-epimerase/fuculose-1-phosphate aldolase